MNQTPDPANHLEVHTLLDRAHASLEKGNSEHAAMFFRRALLLDPALDDVYEEFAQSRLRGPGYKEHLVELHAILKPETYLEIGIASGKTLSLASAQCFVLGVDPFPRNEIVPPLKGDIFRFTSDEFFSLHAKTALGGRRIQLTFIDGLHLFEQVLRDFMHAESLSSRHGIIAIHDTLPLASLQAERTQKSKHWCGDVWKLIPCLQAFRPDLRIATLPCYPSGLTLVSNLDPENTTLSEAGERALHSFSALQFAQYEKRLDQIIETPNLLRYALEGRYPHPAWGTP